MLESSWCCFKHTHPVQPAIGPPQFHATPQQPVLGASVVPHRPEHATARPVVPTRCCCRRRCSSGCWPARRGLLAPCCGAPTSPTSSAAPAPRYAPVSCLGRLMKGYERNQTSSAPSVCCEGSLVDLQLRVSTQAQLRLQRCAAGRAEGVSPGGARLPGLGAALARRLCRPRSGAACRGGAPLLPSGLCLPSGALFLILRTVPAVGLAGRAAMRLRHMSCSFCKRWWGGLEGTCPLSDVRSKCQLNDAQCGTQAAELLELMTEKGVMARTDAFEVKLAVAGEAAGLAAGD